jgi:hypothetical protein
VAHLLSLQLFLKGFDAGVDAAAGGRRRKIG